VSSHATPISPVDFNLKKRERQPFILNRTSASLQPSSVYTQSHNDTVLSKRDRTRWSDHEDMKRSYIVPNASTRIAQTLIMQELNVADESIQSLLLELIVTKELRMSNVKYNVPKPSFLVIGILPQGYDRLAIASQLVRHHLCVCNNILLTMVMI
jgi:MoxR-like ATPase